MMVVLFLYLIQEKPIVGQTQRMWYCIYYELNEGPNGVQSPARLQGQAENTESRIVYKSNQTIYLYMKVIILY